MCTAVVHLSPSMARCSASMPQPGTSSMNTLKAGSSNWMTSTPSACSARLGLMRAAFQRKRAAHHRHHGFVTVGADAHLDLVGEIDAIDEFQKTMHEMLARHFAVADDIDAGVLLHFDREPVSYTH